MIDTGLKGKVAIVTGANHGIGAAIAVALAKEKARVVVHYYRAGAEAYGDISEEKANKATAPGRAYLYKMQTKSADEVIETIRDMGSECFALESDLAHPENIPTLFDRAEEVLGPVDMVVNNAAYCKCDTFIPEFELKKQTMFAGQYPKVTIRAESHDRHFEVNCRWCTGIFRGCLVLCQQMGRRKLCACRRDGIGALWYYRQRNIPWGCEHGMAAA